MSSSTKSAFTDDYRTIPGLYTITDLSAAQFKAVKLLSTVGRIALIATSAPTQLTGYVLMNDPKGTSTAPVPAEVAYEGIVKMIAGTSTINQGDKLGVNTTSQVVGTTTDNRFVIGTAMGKSAAVGDIIPVQLIPGGARY